jgi:biopolymer transport protein ExbD
MVVSNEGREIFFMPRQRAMWSPSQEAARRAASRRPTFYTSINFWPIVGVAFCLLLLFMTDVRLHPHFWVAVVLPKSIHATAQDKALREDAIRISIVRDGRVYFTNSRVRPESLPALIRGAVQDGAEKKVYLEVDERASYGDTAKVVDQIRIAGIREVCFLTHELEER